MILPQKFPSVQALNLAESREKNVRRKEELKRNGLGMA